MARASSKLCKCCGQPRPRAEFYAKPGARDGLQARCRSCARRASRDNYARRRAYYAAYDAARAQTSGRKRSKAAMERAYRARYPNKYRARRELHRALRDGTLKKLPCQACGSRARVEAHHLDYRSPLKVVWVCFRCHRERGHGHVVAKRR